METVISEGTYGNTKLTLFASFVAFLRDGTCIADISVNFSVEEKRWKGITNNKVPDGDYLSP